MKEFTPFPGAVITHSVRFVCSEYDFSGKHGITIAGDDIEIDGNGAVIRGGMAFATPIQVVDADDSSVPAGPVSAESRYFGTGIQIFGQSGIFLRNITLTGFDLGIQIDHCENVILEKCNVSGCFHDPDWGWDERGNHGGILLSGSKRCVIRSCRANQVWDALHLQYSDNNLLEGNDFSRTSNTGLKMWRSCGNRILNNDLSWGIRISPGEVHARDSSCVLVESGSNDNVFRNNDMTHGGDGFFIRVLNGWMSTGNLLENNDCSYANNNGIEAWADSNIYISNKTNHCSYGFWLGNSNHTVLLENEAAYNGSDFHNAPEAFGNAGIAFVNGSCSHSIIKGNHIHHNTGPGIAIRNSRENPSLHVLISNNRIEHNRSKGTFFGHGIYLKHTRLVLLHSNDFSGNEGEELFADGEDNDIYTLDNEQKYGNPENLTVNLEPGIILAGKPVRFRVDAGQGSPVHWDFGDGSFAAANQPDHVYSSHGMFPLSITSTDEQGVRLAGRAIHVLPSSFEPFEPEEAECPEGTLAFQPGIYGLNVPHASWKTGTERRLLLHSPRRKIVDDSVLILQLQYTGDQQPDWEKSRLFPVVTLFSDSKNYLVIKPEKPLMSMETALFSEYRGSGCILLFPLSSRPGFLVSKHGEGIHGGVLEIEIDCGASDAVQSSLIVNAVGFAIVRDDFSAMPDLIPGNLEKAIPIENITTYWENHDIDAKEGIAFREHFIKKCETTDAAGVVFRASIVIDQTQVVMRPRLIGGYQQESSAAFALLPLESLSAGMWKPVELQNASSYRNGICTYRFKPVNSEGLRLAGTHDGMRDGIARFSAFFTNSVRNLRVSAKTGRIRIDSISIKLNKESNLDNKPLPDLTVEIYTLTDEDFPGQRIYSNVVPESMITPYKPFHMPVSGLFLQEGSRYALVLGQIEMAESREKGGYYRWICGKVHSGESFGTLVGDEAKPSEYDWGTAWLIVSGEGAHSQLVHFSDHVGVRFGLPEIPRRYQTFTAPRRSSLMRDNKMSCPCYCAQDEDIEIESTERISGFYIYFGDNVPDSVGIKDENRTVIHVLSCNRQKIQFYSVNDLTSDNKKFLISIHGSADIAEIVAVSGD